MCGIRATGGACASPTDRARYDHGYTNNLIRGCGRGEAGRRKACPYEGRV